MGKNRGLLAWGMLVISLSLISIAASRLIWGDQIHERALAKAQATVEWLKGCGIHWKNLFLFMLVAIPGMAILTRVIAWYAARFKEPSWRKPGVKEIEFLDEVVKPYATYEEYKKDLTGDVDLDHFLARCRAGLPADMLKTKLDEDLKRKVARERLAEIQKRIVMGGPSGGPLGSPQQPTPGSSPRDYRPV